MQIFRWLWQQNSIKGKELKHQLLLGRQAFFEDPKLLIWVPPYIEPVARSLCNLCQEIETLSAQSVLHPSKCRCLAKSYTVLVGHVLSLTSPLPSSSYCFEPKLSALLTALLHTLQEGKRFVQDCTYQERKVHLCHFGSARNYEQQWLMNKALAVALSTEILDVHLHDLVWCISILIWLLTNNGDAELQAKRVDSLLKETWALADTDGDVKSMQELFEKISARGHEHICNLIQCRLSESPSNAQLNVTSDADVPAYLCMDPRHFEHIRSNMLGSSDSAIVFETRLMGRSFACKTFYRMGDEETFKYEAKVQASLRHANVVQLVCCTKKPSEGRIDSSLVMELMQRNLLAFISKRRSVDEKYTPFSLLAGVDLMLQVAKGIEYLHNFGIMHRDIKSLNILVSPSLHDSYLEEEGHVKAKVADFGISKFWQGTSLLTKKVGTGIWRAPEVVDEDDEKNYTDKADVYSYAIVCSEIWTGLRPDDLLPCNRQRELLKLLKEGRRPELPSICPVAISSYIKRCWHGDPSKRPSFKQICRVLRFFKACILLGETEMLAAPLQDDMLEFEELQGAAAERQSEGIFYHPILDIPSEMHVFRSIWELRRRALLEHLGLRELLIHGQGVPMEILVSKVLGLYKEVISEGSLGTAYKCRLEDGSFIFVKRLRKGIIERNKQLVDMVKLKHDNLVPLLAHCYTEDEDLLVFDYMTNGSCLSGLLHGNRILDWNMRLRVALDAAIGIDYLHDHGYIHGHIKSSNILLIDNNNRCVFTAYGVQRAVPEYVGHGDPHELRLTKEADVYSYGMLLHELSTGQNPEENNGGLLVEESLPREEQIKTVDIRVHKCLDKQEEMQQIALKCLDSNPSRRLAMKQVVKMVEDLEKT